MSSEVPFTERLRRHQSLDSALVPRWIEQHCGGDVDTVERLHAGFNHIFRFVALGERRLLRISGLRRRAELDASTDYHAHLHACGAPVCRPIAFESGAWVEEFAPEDGPPVIFVCTIASEVAGVPITNRCREPRLYRAWGRAMAQLHVAAESYRPGTSLEFWSWRKEWRNVDQRIAESDDLARAEFQRIDAWLQGLLDTQERCGITHGDYNAGNVIWDGACATTIDFEEPVRHWFAADAARPFSELLQLPLDERLRYRTALVEGYREFRALEDEVVAELAWFNRLKALDFYTWNLVEAGMSRDAPEIVELRKRFDNPTKW